MHSKYNGIFVSLLTISLLVCILHFWWSPNRKNTFTNVSITDNMNVSTLNVEDIYTPNNTKCPVELIRHGNYATINGVNVSTESRVKWLSYGFTTNCSHNVNDYKTVSTINISMWRGDGLGAQLYQTMKFISISLWNPSKYHYYYFPFLFRSEYLYKTWMDLRKIESFINIGYKESNIFNEPCICCIWGDKISEIDPNIKRLNFFNDTVRKHLRHKYFQNKQNLSVYNDRINNISIFNVAVHIRRGDVKEANEKRKLLSDVYYIQIMKRLFWNKMKLNITSIYFHIYSQWNFDKKHFENLLETKTFVKMYNHSQFKLKYYLNTDLNLTFHGMVTADALITSKSSLSRSASLLSASKYIFYTGRGALKHWISCTKVRAKCKYSNGTRF